MYVFLSSKFLVNVFKNIGLLMFPIFSCVYPIFIEIECLQRKIMNTFASLKNDSIDHE